MRIKGLISFLFLALCLLSSLNSLGLAQKRGAEQRVVRPLFDLKPTITREEAKAQVGLVRSYLWDLWKARNRASFRVRSYTLEGDPTTCHYSVEPRQEGGWQVVSKCQWNVCPYTSKARCRKYLKPYLASYDLVERRIRDHQDSLIVVSDDQRLAPTQFVLILTNSASGKKMEL